MKSFAIGWERRNELGWVEELFISKKLMKGVTDLPIINNASSIYRCDYVFTNNDIQSFSGWNIHLLIDLSRYSQSLVSLTIFLSLHACKCQPSIIACS